MDEMICYCFKITAAELADEVRRCGGASPSLERILEAKGRGACRCAEAHPEHR